MNAFLNLFFFISMIALLSTSNLLPMKYDPVSKSSALESISSVLPLKNVFTNEYPELSADFGTFNLPNYPKNKKSKKVSQKSDSKTSKLIQKLIRQSMKQNVKNLKNRKLINPSNNQKSYLLNKSQKKYKLKKSIHKTQSTYNGLDFSNFLKNMSPISQRKLKQVNKNLLNKKIVLLKNKFKSFVTEKLKKKKLESTSDQVTDISEPDGSIKKYITEHFVPEKLGRAFLAAGGTISGIKTYLHQHSLQKLNKIKKKEYQKNLQTRSNNHLLSKLSNVLKRTSDELNQMKEHADERLSSKINQIRNY